MRYKVGLADMDIILRGDYIKVSMDYDILHNVLYVGIADLTGLRVGQSHFYS